MKIKLLLSGFGLLLILQGCVSVEAYQRMYLDDPDMELAPKKLERFETDAETYREGAAGGNQGTAGGGCGCY